MSLPVDPFDPWGEKVALSDKREDFDSKLKSPHPLDRIASLVVDVTFVLIPVSSLFTAGLRQKMLQNRMLEDTGNWGLAAALILLCSFFIFWIYLSLSHWLFRRTLGQSLFQIRIVTESGEALGFMASLRRNFFWIVTHVMSLGSIALLTLGHSTRRSAADLICETKLVSHSSLSDSPPSMRMRRSISYVFLAFSGVFMLTGGVVVGAGIRFLGQPYLPIQELAAKDCDGFSSRVKEALRSPEGNGSDENSLAMALAFIELGEYPFSCLAPGLMESGEDNPFPKEIISIAKLIRFVEVEDLSLEYINQNCIVDSPYCALATRILARSESRQVPAEVRAELPDNVLGDIWRIREAVAKRDWLALNQLELEYHDVSFMAALLLSARIARLRDQKNESALEQVLMTAQNLLPEAPAFLKVEEWACSLKMTTPCSPQTVCAIAAKKAIIAQDWLKYRRAECLSQDLEPESLASKEMQSLLEAKVVGEAKGAAHLMGTKWVADIIENPWVHSPVRFEIEDILKKISRGAPARDLASSKEL